MSIRDDILARYGEGPYWVLNPDDAVERFSNLDDVPSLARIVDEEVAREAMSRRDAAEAEGLAMVEAKAAFDSSALAAEIRAKRSARIEELAAKLGVVPEDFEGIL
jgi:hypothetical protein